MHMAPDPANVCECSPSHVSSFVLSICCVVVFFWGGGGEGQGPDGIVVIGMLQYITVLTDKCGI